MKKDSGTSPKLLNCPFCGFPAQLAKRSDGGIQVNCVNAATCWATVGPLYPDNDTQREEKRIAAKVVGQWNRRES